MVQQKTPYILCMSLFLLGLSGTYTIDAMQGMPLITAAQSWELCKKISKITATVGIGYWLIRTILNHKISHTDTTTYPSNPERLEVVTDGKVTIRKSHDGKTHVTHRYGASWGSYLSSLHFSDNYDGKKLEVHGHSTSIHRPFFKRILEFLLHLKPQKTLHHIIEVPDSTVIDITSTNSSLYSHRNSFIVTIDSLINAIRIHAHTGNVKVICPKESAQLRIVHTHPADSDTHSVTAIRDTHSRMASLHEPVWVHNQEICQPASPIEIHTPDKVVAENFQGDLHIFDDGQQFPRHQQQIDLTRHSQNHYGHVFINGSKQPFSLHYPIRADISQQVAAPAAL